MNCECGCEKPVSIGRRFLVGHNMRGEDLTGRTFGNRKVLGPSPKKFIKENRKWLTVCACGKEQVVKGTKLLNGISKGCRSCNNGWKKRPFESLYNVLCLMAKDRCDVLLSYEDYLTFTKTSICHYCGVNITWLPHGYNAHGHHLDRKENSLGYSKSNCVVCCSRCNRAKSDHFTYEEWIQIGEVIRSWHI
jgi:hypothetical protein